LTLPIKKDKVLSLVQIVELESPDSIVDPAEDALYKSRLITKNDVNPISNFADIGHKQLHLGEWRNFILAKLSLNFI
jgi:hypothetical protein